MDRFCLVHDAKWRGPFQRMVNQLRRSDTLHKSCVGQFQKRVCGCHRDEPTENEFQIPQEFDFVTQDLPKPVLALLEDLSRKDLWDTTCNHSNNECPCPVSVKLMLYLGTLVTSNNFNFNNTDVDGKDGTERTNDYKLTNKFVISGLHPDHLGLIIGTKGKNIKRFEHEFGCSIKLCKEDGDVVSASVETPWSKKDALPRLMASLSLAGRSIAAKRLQHNRRVQEYCQRKPGLQTGFKAKQVNVKKLNTINYEKKAEAHYKHRHHQFVIPPKLEGSRCLNCLQKYSQKSFREATCRHHPGFLVVKMADCCTERHAGTSPVTYGWTCCMTGSHSIHPDHTQHEESGCTVGIHNWRCETRKKKPASSGYSLKSDLTPL